MAIKVVTVHGRLWGAHPDDVKNDCIVLRMNGNDANFIDMSFPFHEDTPNFQLTIQEVLDIRNAIDQLVDIKMLEKPKGENE